jgi:hypothetical protein
MTLGATAPTRDVTRIDKARVGHATGVMLAGGVECIVITATREDAQAFMDKLFATPGDARFSAPVAMVQRKDVAITPIET